MPETFIGEPGRSDLSFHNALLKPRPVTWMSCPAALMHLSAQSNKISGLTAATCGFSSENSMSGANHAFVTIRSMFNMAMYFPWARDEPIFMPPEYPRFVSLRIILTHG